MSDILRVHVLKDGTVKVETDQVSEANHVSAEGVLGLLATLCGGDVTRTLRGDAPLHAHEHGEGTLHQH